jgi:carbamoyl-phosphate synthase small subunit
MKGFLCLQDGSNFEGEAFVSTTEAVQGEIVFFTGMTGYQEVLTDPSYKDQIVVFTYPLIGNYGINESDFESAKPQVSGVIMLQCTDHFSHYAAQVSLREYLEKWQIPYMTGVDTREVVKSIRKKGSQNACIAAHKPATPSSASLVGQIDKVVGSKVEMYGSGDTHIALIDFGVKKSILSSLLDRNCRVTVVPYDKISILHSLKVDGMVLSNGPGDPKEMKRILLILKEKILQLPTLGICLGHQLIALALGGNTKKLLFGHRGANHPVRDDKTGKVFLTSQNHNYVVDDASLKETNLIPRFINVNDRSVEGMKHNEKPILSVQFHPEAHPGPVDASWIFDEFFNSIKQLGREKLYA